MLSLLPPPADNTELREKIYASHIFKAAPTLSSLAVIDYIKEAIAKETGLPLETAHKRHTGKDLSEKLRSLRLALIEDIECQSYVRSLMADFGFAAENNAFDFIRLRGVMPNGHLNPALERAYSLHRDTWYANPQCQVNWWIALQDTPAERTFSFYPAFFDKKVENTSGAFDYDTWMNTVGWQGTRKQQNVSYPHTLEILPAAERKGFSCRAGEVLLFSAAHLHQTNPNSTDLCRFSIDFRTAHLDDHYNFKGAPNADNGSSPDVLKDYILPAGYTP